MKPKKRSNSPQRLPGDTAGSNGKLTAKYLQLEQRCSHCGREFLTPGKLVEHIKREHKEGFPCPFEACDKLYMEIKSLNRHVQRKHKDNQFREGHDDHEEGDAPEETSYSDREELRWQQYRRKEDRLKGAREQLEKRERLPTFERFQEGAGPLQGSRVERHTARDADGGGGGVIKIESDSYSEDTSEESSSESSGDDCDPMENLRRYTKEKLREQERKKRKRRMSSGPSGDKATRMPLRARTFPFRTRKANSTSVEGGNRIELRSSVPTPPQSPTFTLASISPMPDPVPPVELQSATEITACLPRQEPEASQRPTANQSVQMKSVFPIPPSVNHTTDTFPSVQSGLPVSNLPTRPGGFGAIKRKMKDSYRPNYDDRGPSGRNPPVNSGRHPERYFRNDAQTRGMPKNGSRGPTRYGERSWVLRNGDSGDIKRGVGGERARERAVADRTRISSDQSRNIHSRSRSPKRRPGDCDRTHREAKRRRTRSPETPRRQFHLKEARRSQAAATRFHGTHARFQDDNALINKDVDRANEANRGEFQKPGDSSVHGGSSRLITGGSKDIPQGGNFYGNTSIIKARLDIDNAAKDSLEEVVPIAQPAKSHIGDLHRFAALDDRIRELSIDKVDRESHSMTGPENRMTNGTVDNDMNGVAEGAGEIPDEFFPGDGSEKEREARRRKISRVEKKLAAAKKEEKEFRKKMRRLERKQDKLKMQELEEENVKLRRELQEKQAALA